MTRPAAVWTSRDPHYEVTCVPCRFGHGERCVGTITVESGPLAGQYTCSCQCRHRAARAPLPSINAEQAAELRDMGGDLG